VRGRPPPSIDYQDFKKYSAFLDNLFENRSRLPQSPATASGGSGFGFDLVELLLVLAWGAAIWKSRAAGVNAR
jgi:hypothetical protein